MKYINKLILFVTVILFTSSIVEARDCSNPKGFHEKMACKLKGVSGNSEKASNEDSDFSKKLKKFLGKKNNQVTGN